MAERLIAHDNRNRREASDEPLMRKIRPAQLTKRREIAVDRLMLLDEEPEKNNPRSHQIRKGGGKGRGGEGALSKVFPVTHRIHRSRISRSVISPVFGLILSLIRDKILIDFHSEEERLL
ncbi:hypothetical protein RB195_008302 [Necator americanus]|uniref:Uncharacterized protein n=1 Tax=Necator americanus TaxID=51031 RepID=A0ABR1CPH8_NECAM